MSPASPKGYAGQAGATLQQIPVVHRPSFHDPAWREQFDREVEAFNEMLRRRPPRTRPLIVAYRQDGEQR